MVLVEFYNSPTLPCRGRADALRQGLPPSKRLSLLETAVLIRRSRGSPPQGEDHMW